MLSPISPSRYPWPGRGLRLRFSLRLMNPQSKLRIASGKLGFHAGVSYGSRADLREERSASALSLSWRSSSRERATPSGKAELGVYRQKSL